jgi:formamidopyrimidine-DNA glycosylase
MPELPEVETVRRGLQPVMEGRRLLGVEQRRPDLRFPFPERFAQRLTGTRIETLERRAKFLVARLGSGEALIMHLGMSGRFSVAAAGETFGFGDYVYDTGADPKHDHVVFHLEGGAAVIFNDPRRFGYMDLVAQEGLEACRHFAALGPEPLGNAFGAAVLAQALAGKRTPLKAALLDQRVVAGLGNIYVCEALFRARLSPLRLAGAVTAQEAERLARAIQAVLREAIAAGGSTLRDFAAADGALGGFQERFDVYDREGAPCACGKARGVVERFVQAGRSTFWCPACQR